MDDINLNEFVTYLLEGDDNHCWDIIMEGAKLKKNVYFYENILADAMRVIGDLWEMNEITVADEHVAANVCNLQLSRYLLEIQHNNGTIRKVYPNRGNLTNKAMFFCVEGEEHSLGLKMDTQMFKEYNWESRYLGANLPIKDSIIYANKWKPDVIGISLSMGHHLPALLGFLKQVEHLDYLPQILIGGSITSLYSLNNYCSSNIMIIKDLYSLDNLLNENKLCKQLYELT
jgi:methanogenic corrinoid protein MtbC1